MASATTAPASIEGVDVRLSTERVEVVLRPQPAGVSPEGLGFAWHRVAAPAGLKVRLISEDRRYRVFRLSVTSADRRWKSKWVRWNFAKRKPSDALPGDSAAAQDQYLSDGGLNFLLAPGETREAFLGFEVVLDGETWPGDVSFEVLVEDADKGGGSETLHANLALRHPISRYLELLPSIYSDAMKDLSASTDEDPPLFFERFLIGFEDAWDPLKRTIDHLDRLFGAYSCPPDHLLFLGAWVCVPFDENWPEMRRRRLVREAVELFRWRGTMRGLSRMIEIYTGVAPQIDDQPVDGWRLGPSALLGTEATQLGGVPDHAFVVNLTVPASAHVREAIIHDIIRTVKPAHTVYTLNFNEEMGA